MRGLPGDPLATLLTIHSQSQRANFPSGSGEQSDRNHCFLIPRDERENGKHHPSGKHKRGRKRERGVGVKEEERSRREGEIKTPRVMEGGALAKYAFLLLEFTTFGFSTFGHLTDNLPLGNHMQTPQQSDFMFTIFQPAKLVSWGVTNLCDKMKQNAN